MKIIFRILIGTIVVLASCSSFKGELKKTSDKEAIIDNAIVDFMGTKKLYKKDTIFSIKVLELTDNNEILVVRISKNNMKILMTKDIKIGSKTNKIPTRYFEKDGKLFFWWDDNYPLTEKTLQVFDRYNLLQDDEDGWVKFPESIIDETQKAAHYYFCKEDLATYKRVITNKGIGYYDTPKLNCNSN